MKIIYLPAPQAGETFKVFNSSSDNFCVSSSTQNIYYQCTCTSYNVLYQPKNSTIYNVLEFWSVSSNLWYYSAIQDLQITSPA